MLLTIHPKLPMRDKEATRKFYTDALEFELVGEYPDYLIVQKDNIQIHFFEFRELNPLENYGQVYIRTNQVETLFGKVKEKKLPVPTAGQLQKKPWGQWEFSLTDPDHNLLTFGQSL